MSTKTIISDIIIPEVFNPYVVEKTAELSALYNSGIIRRNDELDRLAQSGGKLLNMPYWEDLGGDDEVLSDVEALTPGKIEAEQDVAVLLMRGRAWSVNDLARALSGDDPMQAIGNLVAEYWARRWQVTLISILNGIFGDPATGMDGNKHDITNETETTKRVINANTTIDALYKLGDANEKLTGFGMHSATVAKLAKDDLIDYLPDSKGRPTIPTYLGKRVIVDDGMPASGGNYTTYIFGEGAIGLGEGSAPVPTETDRDSLAGDDLLINRRHFILHPRGVKFKNVFVSGSSPTNNELGMYQNWERVYENKNVRIVQFKHKLD